MRTLLPATIALVLLSTSCSKETAEEPPTGYDTVQLNYMNTPLPGITTAGQLTEEQFDALVQQGVKNIVSLRDAGEQGTGWEEARADAAGIRFVRIPVTGGPRGINLENATALDAALEASGGGETVVYCGSSNRVGALFACRAHWLQGKTKDEALALGKSAGATQYVKVIENVLEMK